MPQLTATRGRRVKDYVFCKFYSKIPFSKIVKFWSKITEKMSMFTNCQFSVKNCQIAVQTFLFQFFELFPFCLFFWSGFAFPATEFLLERASKLASLQQHQEKHQGLIKILYSGGRGTGYNRPFLQTLCKWAYTAASQLSLSLGTSHACWL